MNIERGLVEARDDAINAAADAHERMDRARERYQGGENSYKNVKSIARLEPLAQHVMFNKGAELVDKVHPRLEEGTPRAEFILDDTDEFAAMDIRELNMWLAMYEEIDFEGNIQSLASQHVLVEGMAIRKLGWNVKQNRLVAPVIPPCQFAPDPNACQVSLADAMYTVQWNTHSEQHIKAVYGYEKPRPANAPHISQNLRVDEMWLREEYAESIGIAKPERMVKAVLVDDKLVELRKSPWQYPDFPYVCWRNFMMRTPKSGKPVDFFGHGYIDKIWDLQCLYDEFVAEILMIMRNESTGRLAAPKGMFSEQWVEAIRRMVLEYDGEMFDINQLKELPSGQVPPILIEMLNYVDRKIESLTGISAVFSGESPHSGASGRAIAALQAAAFTHISNILRGMVQFVSRLAYIKGRLIQQLARRPADRNAWRYGVDIKHPFSPSARHIGYTVQVHDTSELPQTPAGKLAYIQSLREFGIALKPEKTLEILGIDKGYGIGATDLIDLTNPTGGQIPAEDILTTRDVVAV